MKHNALYLEQLRQEVPRKNLSPKATQRFEDTYRMLGVQKETPVYKRRPKGFWITATAACLCCGLLFGVNAAFPAFAESLPGVGKFFEAINGAFPMSSGKDLPVGTYLGTYPEVQDVNVTVSSGNYTMNVLQAFSDGEILTFSLDVVMPQEEAQPYSWLVTRNSADPDAKNAVVTINGTTFETDGETALFSQGDGHFMGSMSFHLPQKQEAGSEVAVEISMPQMWGRLANAKSSLGEKEFSLLEPGFSTSFITTVNTNSNCSFSCDTEDNGFHVTNVEASPIKTAVTVSLPQLDYIDGQGGEGVPVIYTMDGNELEFALTESMDQGGYDPFTGTAQNSILTFDGIPQGTEQLVLRFYQDYKQDKVLAEFTIDLANHTVTPSTTYQDGGVLDINGPFHYDNLHWYADENPQFTNGLALKNLTFTKSDNSLRVSVDTYGDYREITVTIYNGAGMEIGSADSSNAPDNLSNMNNYFVPKEQYGWKHSSYCLNLTGPQVYMPAINETLTVVITDTTSSEEILRQEVTMDKPVIE